jgi:hypothetical protein
MACSRGIRERESFLWALAPDNHAVSDKINRQLFQAMNQLERLQRLRKGDNVPAPVNLEVFGEPPTMSEKQNSDR